MEPEKSSGSSMFFPIDKLHEVIREERIAALLEIDEQRKTTLVYLTQERIAVAEELKAELTRITDLLVAERRAVMLEMGATGNLIAENALLKSKRLIDHFFCPYAAIRGGNERGYHFTRIFYFSHGR